MWWSYQDAQETKERLQREIAKRVQRGEVFEALEVPVGKKKLCTTYWGQAWCRNLESYQNDELRLPRGRSYLRQGQVYNLEIAPGLIRAEVLGADIYESRIHIKPLSRQRWQEIVAASSGQVGSMLDLLAGRLGDELLQRLASSEEGLFPQPKEIRFDCSCPDVANMCKHVAAVLYGVGVRLDSRPEWLFTLRGVDPAELLAEAGAATAAELGTGNSELAGTDLAALFGIELMDEEPAASQEGTAGDQTSLQPGLPATGASSMPPTKGES